MKISIHCTAVCNPVHENRSTISCIYYLAPLLLKTTLIPFSMLPVILCSVDPATEVQVTQSRSRIHRMAHTQTLGALRAATKVEGCGTKSSSRQRPTVETYEP